MSARSAWRTRRTKAAGRKSPIRSLRTVASASSKRWPLPAENSIQPRATAASAGRDPSHPTTHGYGPPITGNDPFGFSGRSAPRVGPIAVCRAGQQHGSIHFSGRCFASSPRCHRQDFLQRHRALHPGRTLVRPSRDPHSEQRRACFLHHSRRCSAVRRSSGYRPRTPGPSDGSRPRTQMGDAHGAGGCLVQVPPLGRAEIGQRDPASAPLEFVA